MLLRLGIGKLEFPPRIYRTSACFADAVPKEAVSSEIRVANRNVTLVKLSLERFSVGAYAEIASLRIDAGEPILFVFNDPGSKTIFLSGTQAGIHKMSITTLMLEKPAFVTEVFDRDTCTDFTSV